MTLYSSTKTELSIRKTLYYTHTHTHNMKNRANLISVSQCQYNLRYDLNPIKESDFS